MIDNDEEYIAIIFLLLFLSLKSIYRKSPIKFLFLLSECISSSEYLAYINMPDILMNLFVL